MDSRSKDLVRQQYSRQAHLYARSRPYASGDTLSLMARWAACQGSETVLDAACGCGFCAFALAPMAARVMAIDITPRMLEEASRLAEQRGLSNIEFQAADAEALPFPDGHFHIVSCRISAHHFSSPSTFLSESWRVLIPGGRLLLADTSSPEDPELCRWQNETERLHNPSHVQNFTPSQWKEMVQRAGFAIAEFSTEYRSHLEFSDWVRTSGCSPETISLLLQRFEQAPPQVKRAFQIQPRGDQIAFSWPITALKAIKP